jgi:hypothetical protein
MIEDDSVDDGIFAAAAPRFNAETPVVSAEAKSLFICSD